MLDYIKRCMESACFDATLQGASWIPPVTLHTVLSQNLMIRLHWKQYRHGSQG